MIIWQEEGINIFMRIIVCIKQVPGSTKVAVDPKTGILIRDGKDVKMNPYDLYALEAAFQLKDLYKDVSITVLTMGPESATSILYEALYMGADDACFVSDRRFAGADVLATSYTLSQTLKLLEPFDLIIYGKQTTDGDTAQVGPETAEFLGIPHVSYVKEFIQVNKENITLMSAYDTYEEIVKIPFPCLITIEKDAFVPRLPSYRRKLTHINDKIKRVSLSQFEDQDPEHYGLSGSPTQVEEIFLPQHQQKFIKLEGSGKDLAEQIKDILKENNYI